ncbi:HigA family addiction module antitoxin [Lichenicola sp.]|uniref:HigA family addiction module antitoxin n=1 Tax=Lichenicola sp. TaxID=2804529 RepID=UPI003AFF6B37
MDTLIAASPLPAFEPTHPGAVIRDVLATCRISVTKAAARIHVTPPTLNNVVRGTASISPDMALRLGRLCGNSPEMWLRLQEHYDLWHRQRALADDLATIQALQFEPA